jgi:uncharacterized membrane protein
VLGCLPLFLVLLLLAPLFLLLTYFNAITLSFHRLGLSTEGAMLLFAASLIGGMINLPISRRPILVPEQRGWGFLGYFFYYPPRVQEQVIAINVGGAVIPLLFSLYLLPRAPLVPTALTGAIVAAVCKAIARPVPNVGIAMPAFIPPLVAVAAALAFAPGQAAPVAYIGGTLGTLIGADLLNLLGVRRMPALMLSIGGAGVFDGVFLVGILSALLT